MDYSSKIRKVKRALASLVPSLLKVVIHQRLRQAKLKRLLRTKRRFRLKLRTTKRQLGIPQGVNLVGYIRAEMGLGAAARGMASAFESANIPFNVLNVQLGSDSRQGDLSWTHKEVRDSSYDITVACVNPDNSSLRTQVPTRVLGKRYVIGNWYWELPEIPDEWLSEFEFTDEVWAASQFIRDAISRKSPVPVVRVPPVVGLSQGRHFSKSELGLPERRYLFLAMFDTNSVLERKNPLGALGAFKQAFANADPNVTLILKFLNPDYAQPLLQRLLEETTGQDNVIVLDRVMDRDEVSSLIRVSDCFVSLHHSEGFGLGPAEAMSVGKPAIITNWSGNTDYMTPDNSIAIDYELVTLGRDYGPYKSYQHWAEPDIEQAAYWMKRIVEDAELAKIIGRRAQETIDSEFSPTAVGRIIKERLEHIREGRN